MPDGKRARRHCTNKAKRQWYARYRSIPFSPPFWTRAKSPSAIQLVAVTPDVQFAGLPRQHIHDRDRRAKGSPRPAQDLSAVDRRLLRADSHRPKFTCIAAPLLLTSTFVDALANRPEGGAMLNILGGPQRVVA